MRETGSAAARDAHHGATRQADRVPAKVYAVMALTTALTFATLTTGYQFLFTHQLYA